MLDIAKILEELDLIAESSFFKTAAVQPDLLEPGLEQDLTPAKETDRYKIFRDKFSQINHQSDELYYQSLVKKHLYKLWLDNIHDKTSEELYEELSNLDIYQTNKEWEKATSQYPHQKIELPDTRQIALPIEVEPEIRVAPSYRELREFQQSYSDQNIEVLKEDLKQLEVLLGGNIIKECINSSNTRTIGSFISGWHAKHINDENSKEKHLIERITRSHSNFKWNMVPEIIKSCFTTISVTKEFHEEIYSDGIKAIRDAINKCTKIKESISQILSGNDKSLYAPSNPLESVKNTKELETWYCKQVLFVLHDVITSRVGQTVFGNRRIANKTFKALHSAFSSNEAEKWFKDPGSLAKWISSNDIVTSRPFQELGGISIEHWFYFKISAVYEYQTELEAVLKMLKTDLKWLKDLSQHNFVSTGDEKTIKVYNLYIDTFKKSFRELDLGKVLERNLEQGKDKFVLKASSVYNNYVKNAREEIQKGIFQPSVRRFVQEIKREFVKWKTGIDFGNEELNLDKIYASAERRKELKGEFDVSSAWMLPKFLQLDKRIKTSLEEIAKRRIGVTNLAEALTDNSELEKIILNILEDNPEHPAFIGRSESEVLDSLLKHKGELFEHLNDMIAIKAGNLRLSISEFSKDKKIKEAIVDSVKEVYPTIYAYNKDDLSNFYYSDYPPSLDLKKFKPEMYTFSKIKMPERSDERRFSLPNSYSFYINDPALHAEMEKLYLENKYISMLKSLKMQKLNAFGPVAFAKLIELELIRVGGFEDATIKAIKNVGVSMFKQDFANAFNPDNEKELSIQSYGAMGALLIKNTYSFSHKLLENVFNKEFIKKYKVSSESTIEKIINQFDLNFPEKEVKRALSLIFPDTVEQALAQLPKITKFMQWLHSNGQYLDDKDILYLWKNSNINSLVSGDNETISSFFLLFSKLKSYGGYEGIVKKFGHILEIFLKNKNIRAGFKARIIKLTKLIKDNFRLHPEVVGYEDAKALIIEISSDLYVLESSEAFERYYALASAKDKNLYKLEYNNSEDLVWRFRVLKDLDPYHFKVGTDTSCCQSLGQAGQNAAIDSYINPLAGVLVLEIKTETGWKTVSQSYFHFVPKENGYILDNVERSEKNSNLFFNLTGQSIDAAYAKLAESMKQKGVSYFRCGLNYNKLNQKEWKVTKADGLDPRSFSVKKPYTDYSHRKAIDLFQYKGK